MQNILIEPKLPLELMSMKSDFILVANNQKNIQDLDLRGYRYLIAKQWIYWYQETHKELDI